MMTYLFLFLYNLKFPFAFATVIGILIGLVVANRNLTIRDKTDFGSLENKEARYAIMMSLQACVILVFFACILWAVPSPNYQEKIVEKKVYINVPGPTVIKWTKGKQIEYRQPIYNEIFDKCIDTYSYDRSNEIIAQCHAQALELMRAVGK